MSLDESISAGQSAHIADHQSLHKRYNEVVSPREYSDTAAQVLNAAEATTNWSINGVSGVALATDSTIKTTGSSSVKGSVQSGSSGNYVRVNFTSTPVVAGDRVVFDFRYNSNLIGGDPSTVFRFKAYSATAGGGTASIIPFPIGLSEDVWHSLAIDVSTLGTVASFALTADAGSLISGGGENIEVWFDNVHIATSTGLDKAMEDNDAVLIPPDYVPSQTQEVRFSDPTKVVLDMRAGRELLSRHGGVRHAREVDFVIYDDGLTETSSGLGLFLASLSEGEKAQLTPDGLYWCDYPLVLDTDGVELDGQGATIFTKVFRGGDNNVEDPILEVRGKNITVRNLNIFGYHDRTTNGSSLTTVTGTVSTVSTTKVLDANGETVKVPVDSQGRTPFYARHVKQMLSTAQQALVTAYAPTFSLGNVVVVRLSDTNQVASDCVIEMVADDDTSVVLATRTLTLTSSATDYVLTYEPTDLHRNFQIRVRKATATANAITVHSTTEFGIVDYVLSHDSANGISIDGACHALIDNVWVEGAATDALDATESTNYDIKVTNFTSRGCNRQGISFNYGYNITLSDFVIGETGRSGIDIEPYATDWKVRDITIRDGVVYNTVNYAFAIGNWACVKNLNIDNVQAYGLGVGLIIGGARGANISNLTGVCAWTQGIRASSGRDAELGGVGMVVRGLSIDGEISVGNATSIANDGAGDVTYYATNNDIEGTSTVAGYGGVLYTSGRNNRLSVVNVADGQVMGNGSSVVVTGANVPEDGTSLFDFSGSLNRSFPHTYGFETQATQPAVRGGSWFTTPILYVPAIGGARTTTTVLASGSKTSTGTSTAVDLTTRGRSGILTVAVDAASGTSPTMDVAVQCSQDNTNWYTIATLPRFTTTGFHSLPVRFLERYLRLSYTIGGSSPNFTIESTLSHALPGNNLGGQQSVSITSTSIAVAFPARGVGPAIQQVSVSGTTGGSLTPSTTYYYRVGARTRAHGPTTWDSERSVALGGAQNAALLNIQRWNAGLKGVASDGVTILRGTSPGTYTVRYDVLPKANLATSQIRHDFAEWTDLGTSVTIPGAGFSGFPTTYQTSGGPYSVVDESGYELDANYRVVVTPNWSTTCYVSAKTTTGFTVNFGTAAPASQTIDWMVFR